MLYLTLPYSETPLLQRCRVHAPDLHEGLELYRVSCLIVVLPIFEAHSEVFPTLPSLNPVSLSPYPLYHRTRADST